MIVCAIFVFLITISVSHSAGFGSLTGQKILFGSSAIGLADNFLSEGTKDITNVGKAIKGVVTVAKVPTELVSVPEVSTDLTSVLKVPTDIASSVADKSKDIINVPINLAKDFFRRPRNSKSGSNRSSDSKSISSSEEAAELRDSISAPKKSIESSTNKALPLPVKEPTNLPSLSKVSIDSALSKLPTTLKASSEEEELPLLQKVPAKLTDLSSPPKSLRDIDSLPKEEEDLHLVPKIPTQDLTSTPLTPSTDSTSLPKKPTEQDSSSNEEEELLLSPKTSTDSTLLSTKLSALPIVLKDLSPSTKAPTFLDTSSKEAEDYKILPKLTTLSKGVKDVTSTEIPTNFNSTSKDFPLLSKLTTLPKVLKEFSSTTNDPINLDSSSKEASSEEYLPILPKLTTLPKVLKDLTSTPKAPTYETSLPKTPIESLPQVPANMPLALLSKIPKELESLPILPLEAVPNKLEPLSKVLTNSESVLKTPSNLASMPNPNALQSDLASVSSVPSNLETSMKMPTHLKSVPEIRSNFESTTPIILASAPITSTNFEAPKKVPKNLQPAQKIPSDLRANEKIPPIGSSYLKSASKVQTKLVAAVAGVPKKHDTGNRSGASSNPRRAFVDGVLRRLFDRVRNRIVKAIIL